MKLNAILAVAALLGTTALSAQTVQKLDDEKYVLSVQDLSMTVDAGHGGKILSFKLCEQEVLAQNPAAAPQPAQPGEGQPRRRFFNPNSYGSTFWTSPQAEWNWPPVPEYDNLPYTAEIKDGPVKVADVTIPALFLQGQVSKYGYRVCKAFTVDPSDLAFVITYSIVNESGETRKIAPWQISRVPNGGFLEFDAKPETTAWPPWRWTWPTRTGRSTWTARAGSISATRAWSSPSASRTSRRTTPPRAKRRSRCTSMPASPSSKSRRRAPTPS